MFPTRLKELRIKNNLTQKKLAKELNMQNTAISKYELGERKPDYEILEQIGDFFDVSIDYLLGRTDYKINDINEINYVKKEQGRYNSLIDDLTSLSEDSQEEIKKLIELYKIKEMQERNKSKDIKLNKNIK
jgi:transcriptional regulator with XRE-family HTH domain